MLAPPNQLLNSEIQCLETTQGRLPSHAAEAEPLCSACLVTCCWVCLAWPALRPARRHCSRPFCSSGSLPSHVNCMPQPRLDHCSVTAARSPCMALFGPPRRLHQARQQKWRILMQLHPRCTTRSRWKWLDPPNNSPGKRLLLAHRQPHKAGRTVRRSGCKAQQRCPCKNPPWVRGC
jgi:hypothetical protein